MIETVLIFALITAVLEMILLLKYVPLKWLQKKWVQLGIHLVVSLVNLAVHFGTIVGTMTAITAALVSFVTVPAVIYLLSFGKKWKELSNATN